MNEDYGRCMQIKNSVEQKIKSVADKMPSFTYVYEDWTRADVRLERLSLPAIINLLPVSGSLSLKKDQFRDAPNCMLVFVDKVQRDANGSDNEEVFERMKFTAMEFVTRLNQSGLFDPIEGDIPYSVILERLSPVLTGISVSFKLKEVTGVCTSKVLR